MNIKGGINPVQIVALIMLIGIAFITMYPALQKSMDKSAPKVTGDFATSMDTLYNNILYTPQAMVLGLILLLVYSMRPKGSNYD